MTIELLGRIAIILSIIAGTILFLYTNLNYLPFEEKNDK